MSWVAVAIGGSALLGFAGATSAANTQAGAQENAANLQSGMFNQVQGNESPFLQSGQGAQHQLNYLLGTEKPGNGLSAGSSAGGGFGSLLTPFTAQNFQQLSPAYQFQLQQGQQGVLNNDAGAQGALSGASLKDLIGYNQGMANTSFNNAFNQYQTQQGNIYQRLAGVAGLGQQAGANYTSGASQFGGNIGAQVAGAGASQAGGIVGGANALSGGVGSLGALGWLNQNNVQQAIPWAQTTGQPYNNADTSTTTALS